MNSVLSSPSPGWIEAQLHNYVRLNVRSGIELCQQIAERRDCVQREVEYVLDQSHLDDLVNPRIVAPVVQGPLHEQIMSILLNCNFRRGSRRGIDPFVPQFHHYLSARIEVDEPLEIVLPTLPFRDQNPLSTGDLIGNAGLGEMLFIRQLGDLCRSIESIYPPGMRLHIVSDGEAYQEIFLTDSEGDTAGVREYTAECVQIIESLELSDVIEFHDLGDIINVLEEFEYTRSQVRSVLLDLDDEGVARSYFDELALGVMFNCPAFEYGRDIDLQSYAEEISERWEVDGLGIANSYRERAYEYAALLISLRSLDAFRAYFGEMLRATVHPKNSAQIPLHTVGRSSRVAPYNGVPVVSVGRLERSSYLRRCVSCVRLGELAVRDEIMTVLSEEGVRIAYGVESFG